MHGTSYNAHVVGACKFSICSPTWGLQPRPEFQTLSMIAHNTNTAQTQTNACTSPPEHPWNTARHHFCDQAACSHHQGTPPWAPCPCVASMRNHQASSLFCPFPLLWSFTHLLPCMWDLPLRTTHFWHLATAEDEPTAKAPPGPTHTRLSTLVASALEQRASAFGGGEEMEVTPARLLLALLSLAHQVSGSAACLRTLQLAAVMDCQGAQSICLPIAL